MTLYGSLYFKAKILDKLLTLHPLGKVEVDCVHIYAKLRKKVICTALKNTVSYKNV
jgi:hypothetical protein